MNRNVFKSLLIFLFGVFGLVVGTASFAVEQSTFPTVNPKNTLLPVPKMLSPEGEGQTPIVNQPVLKLPSLTSDKAEISNRFQVLVKQIHFDGNSVFSDAELSVLVNTFENRSVSSAELQQVRVILTKHYTEKGYVNSGALLPDQKVENGQVYYQIIEGELKRINISGLLRFKESHIKESLYRGAGKPFNIYGLQKELFVLQQSDNIKHINARFEPGKERGDGVLNVQIVEEAAFHIYARFNNHSPSNVGANRGEISVLHNNISGVGDIVSLSYDVTKGLDFYNVNYKRPILGSRIIFELYHKASESEVVDGDFVVLNAENKSKTTGFNLSIPAYKNSNTQLVFGSIIERRSSDSLALGEPSKFVAGSQNGELRAKVARFYQSWFERTSSRILVARSSFSTGNIGLSFNGSSINRGSRQSVSSSWLGQFQWLERFSKSVGDVIFRANIQFADSPLLSMEQFSLGGVASVRGYREYMMSVDNGVNYSLEYRYPYFTGIHRNPLQIVTFIDYGRGWNKNQLSLRPQEIYSVGIGLRWSNFHGTEFDFYWGKPLVDDDNNSFDDLQSNGVHVNFRIELF